jgi:hypothetical protein
MRMTTRRAAKHIAEVEQTNAHRRERARMIRKLRREVRPGETFTMPADREFYIVLCAVSDLRWPMNRSANIATRPTARKRMPWREYVAGNC